MSQTKLELLLKSHQDVFNVQDLCLYWNMKNAKDVAQLASYYIKQARLYRLKGGLYSLKVNPNVLEIAQKAYTPSYITGVTALKKYGIIFQYYNFFECVALDTRKIKIHNTNYIYHQLPRSILLNQTGLIKESNYIIAGKERAIVDSLYFNSTQGFDNLDGIDKDLLLKISNLYNQPKIWKRILEIFPTIKSDTYISN